jgi:hypothetical protein
VRFCQNFYTRDEPTVGLLSYTNDFGDEMEAIVRKMLSDQLSFLVEHSETGEVSHIKFHILFSFYFVLSISVPVFNLTGGRGSHYFPINPIQLV